MTDSLSIYKGDTAGPWNVGHLLDDGNLATLVPNYTCKIKVPGTAIDRAVTALTTDNKRFIAALTPTETLALAVGQYVVAIEVENTATTPPLRIEKHIILTVAEHIVGSDYLPALDGLELAALKQDRADVWSAIMSAAKGERIKEVWRDGRRVVKDNMSVGGLQTLLDILDRKIAELERETAGKPRRGAIGMVWQH